MNELSTLPVAPDHVAAERIPLGPSRRRILITGGAVVMAAAATAACGSSTPEASSTTPAAPTDAGAQSPSASADAGTADAGTGVEVPIADIAVGGGVIYADQKVVVTQPAAGDFKAFSAVCTHKGCTVAKVADGLITCPCHGSQFSIEDGSVQTGPASAPLASMPVTVSDDTVTVA